MGDQFVVGKPAELEWVSGERELALPQAQIKVFNRDLEDDRVDFLVRFPPGYHEPRHTHTGYHISTIVEGTMIVNDGEHVLGPGDYVFGPSDIPHGPFDYPDGCVVFSTLKGGMRHDSLEADSPTL
jgi:quercetin dioxygenase-like cupin family protein